jgi:hypothetical protein
MGVHPTAWGYSAYDEVAAKLAAAGIPREQVAAIGEADGDAKKRALFDRVRAGSVRVLIGSTAKMGTGTNVQRRLVALHHLDAPWKPAEVEQREGRILRQGNANEEVAIYRYVTEGSFDAYMWQALETKARFIAQVMTGDSAVRRAEDIGGQELSYAEVKAIASGNPAVLTLAEADAELQRLAILRKNHADDRYLARRSLRELPETIARLRRRIEELTADLETAEAHADDPLTLGGRPCRREDALAILSDRLDSPAMKAGASGPVDLGVYRGLRFGLVPHRHGPPEVYLEGATTRSAPLVRENPGPRAVLNALERLADGYAARREAAMQDLAIAEAQLRDYEARLDVPFPHEAYFAELTGLRDRLKAALAEAKPEAGGPSAAELAGRIQSLRGAHTIEAAPERRRTARGAAAEPPVTARIRQRRGAAAIAEPPAEESVATPAVETGPPATEEVASSTGTERPTSTEPATVARPTGDAAEGSPSRPEPHHHTLTVSRRRDKARQLSLF